MVSTFRNFDLVEVPLARENSKTFLVFFLLIRNFARYFDGTNKEMR